MPDDKDNEFFKSLLDTIDELKQGIEEVKQKNAELEKTNTQIISFNKELMGRNNRHVEPERSKLNEKFAKYLEE